MNASMKIKNGGWWIRRAMLVLFDILAVNLSYFLALVMRFYVNSEFRAVAADVYNPAFRTFAPWYTILCILVFACFRLYNSRFRQAGLHDLNRIFLANLVTAAIHVAGTWIFITRMPVTYYVIGAVLQFLLILLSRFSYRIYAMEKTRLARDKVNVMIVGLGETSRMLRRQMDNNNLARPVCLFSWKATESGMEDGIPVISGMDRLPETIKKYHVAVVILADSLMPAEIRSRITAQCRDAEVQDFSGYLLNEGPGLTPARALECVSGPVTLEMDGKRKSFENAEAALMSLHGNYTVRHLSGENLTLSLEPASAVLDLQAAWVRDTEQETGQEISFF